MKLLCLFCSCGLLTVNVMILIIFFYVNSLCLFHRLCGLIQVMSYFALFSSSGDDNRSIESEQSSIAGKGSGLKTLSRRNQGELI